MNFLLIIKMIKSVLKIRQRCTCHVSLSHMFCTFYVDKVPPEFIEGECPDDQILNIDSSDNTALVSWDPPHGRDNSGDTPIIVEVHGYEPGTRFKAGPPHLVKYTIKDEAGNVGSSCQFTVTVKCKQLMMF